MKESLYIYTKTWEILLFQETASGIQLHRWPLVIVQYSILGIVIHDMIVSYGEPLWPGTSLPPSSTSKQPILFIHSFKGSADSYLVVFLAVYS